MQKIGNAQIRMLEKLCNASAVSGDEGEVRKLILAELQALQIVPEVDTLGNVQVTRKARNRAHLKVMVSAHMDEVGFMLVEDEGEGLFRFDTVGGLDLRQLPGKSVLIGKDHLPGVIGARPIHLTTADERKVKIPLDALRIDTGIGSNAIKPGDRAVFATRFQRNGPVLMAKALDNRLGVVTLLELVKDPPAGIELLAAFTVQEELGARGAKVSAYTFDPQVAIVIDSTPANDLPTWDGEENTAYNTRLGQGPAIYIADGDTISDPRLVRFVCRVASEAGIPFQIRQPGSGGTDAGAIHRSRAGIPSISISVPHRYSHTAMSIALLADWQNTFNLVREVLEQLNPGILSPDRS